MFTVSAISDGWKLETDLIPYLLFYYVLYRVTDINCELHVPLNKC